MEENNNAQVTSLISGEEHTLYVIKDGGSCFVGINECEADHDSQPPAHKIPESLYHLLIESLNGQKESAQ